MDNFEVIIKATEEYIKSAGITSIENLKFVRKLTDIVLKQEINKIPYKFNQKYSLKDSIKLVDKFLKNINESYSEYFNERLNDGTFIFKRDVDKEFNAYSDYDYINNKRIIFIPYTNTINDGFLIIHELLHDMNLNEDYISFTRMFYTEGISFLGEILYEKYLKENKIKDANIPLNYSIFGLKERAISTDYNLKLITSRIENGYLDKSGIFEILDTYTTDEIDNIIFTNQDIISDKELSLDVSQTYIFGFLISMALYKNIRENKNNINEFFELNEMLKEYEFEDVLDYLNISYSDGMLTNEEFFNFETNYKQLLKRR